LSEKAGSVVEESPHVAEVATRRPAGAPSCILCGGATTLLYPSNVPQGSPIEKGELSCTSPYLAVHDDIFVCSPCGLARSLPAATGPELDDLYRDVEDDDYLTSEDERRAAFRAALERIERHDFLSGRGRLLEIGSAAGLFLDEAQNAGWDAIGIEPSRWGTEAAKARRLSVFTGTLDEFPPETEPFDVVTSWDVWEHLEDPLGALQRTFELLRPGGLFVFTTINMGGLGRKIFRGRWPWFMRMHLYYFTPRSLRALVERSGFQVLSVTTEPKTLKLGYVLDRAQSFLGPAARLARALVGKLGLSERRVRIDLGDILLVEARKPEHGTV
jgi:SAM-dependent methyltransferase